MGNARRHAIQDAPRAPYSRRPDAPYWCPDSPYCAIPPSLYEHFAAAAGIWLHYGPIPRLAGSLGTRRTTPLAIHRADADPTDPMIMRLDVETPAGMAGFDGCHLELFCLKKRPPTGGAVRHVQPIGGTPTTFWRLYAIAWRDEGGPIVRWKIPGYKITNEGYSHNPGTTRSSAEDVATFLKLEDLIAGAAPRRGRPPRFREDTWRGRTIGAVERYDRYPSITWDAIAESLHISPSQLRADRALLRREQEEHDERLRLVERGEP